MYDSRCSCDPTIKKLWGCEKPTQHAVWEDCLDNKYYTCPIKFLTDNVIEWYNEYTYYKEFGCLHEYTKLPATYVEAMSLYNNYIATYKLKELEEDNRKQSLKNNNPLMKTVMGRKKG